MLVYAGTWRDNGLCNMSPSKTSNMILQYGGLARAHVFKVQTPRWIQTSVLVGSTHLWVLWVLQTLQKFVFIEASTQR